MLKTALKYSHDLLQQVIKPGDLVVDATMGNGYDTAFLSDIVTATGHVYAFDIQEQALIKTQEKLADKQNVTLIQASHHLIANYLPADSEIKAAVFNLGYLPSGDKSIITHADTTIQALEWLLAHLSKQGRIVLVLYYGHAGGATEKDAVLEFAAQLPQEDYQVLTYQFINQKNCPPICLCIEKK